MQKPSVSQALSGFIHCSVGLSKADDIQITYRRVAHIPYISTPPFAIPPAYVLMSAAKLFISLFSSSSSSETLVSSLQPADKSGETGRGESVLLRSINVDSVLSNQILLCAQEYHFLSFKYMVSMTCTFWSCHDVTGPAQQVVNH